MDIPAGATQEECHAGFLHLHPAGLTLVFAARRIQQLLLLVDRQVGFCVRTNYVFYTCRAMSYSSSDPVFSCDHHLKETHGSK